MSICPACNLAVDPANPACCTGCGFRFVQPGKTTLVRPAARPKIQVEVDLAIATDRTGSSEQFQIGIPKSFDIIVRQLVAKTRGVRCWLQSHGDFDEGENFILHCDGGKPEQALADLRSIKYGGGGDPPEHHLCAIENLVRTVPFTADARRARGAILGFLTADTKPARSGRTAREIGAEILDRGLLLYLICEPTPTLSELIDAAGGLLFPISNDPDPAELARIAAQVAASIVATVGSGDTRPLPAAA